jgi:hypothetical protein
VVEEGPTDDAQDVEGRVIGGDADEAEEEQK